ncbi:hypothetical protein CN447_28995 [Bacillus thuringiensis]|nr:hypothetical protein CN447_28995 [Bacillus thuringiensis]PGS64239.1 hypothetical protein COD07_28005 [Bacillus thuringiensis]
MGERIMKILIEGLDCSGKTTLTNRIVEKFKSEGYPIRINQGGLYKGFIHRLAHWMYRTEKLNNTFLLNLMFALVHIVDGLKYKHYGIFVQDGSYDRMIAYQKTFGFKLLSWLMEKLSCVLIKYDLIIYLEVNYSIRVKRMYARKKNNVNDSIMLNQPEKFLELEKCLYDRVKCKKNCVVINTTNLNENEIVNIASKHVNKILISKGIKYADIN